MMKMVVWLSLLGCPSPTDEATEIDIPELAERIRAKHQQPALAIAAVNSQGLLGQGVAGVRRHGDAQPVEQSDLFHVGSCTKAMTATALAGLVEEGELSWEITVAEAFSDRKEEIRAEYLPVTLHQLLSHTGGVIPGTSGQEPIFETFRENESLDPVSRRQELVVHALSQPPVNRPGHGHSYSNVGYGIAVAIAESQTGREWTDLMQEYVFEPAEMKRVGFGWPATPENPHQPAGHYPGSADPTPMELDDPYRLSPEIDPAGDVHCSIESFALFARMHLRGLRGEDDYLAAESVGFLHEPVMGDYGCGWMKRGIGGVRASWHNGSAGSFMAWMAVFPEHDLAIVACANSGSGESALQEATVELLQALSKESASPAR